MPYRYQLVYFTPVSIDSMCSEESRWRGGAPGGRNGRRLLFDAALATCMEIGADAFTIELDTASTSTLLRQKVAFDLASSADEARCLLGRPRRGVHLRGVVGRNQAGWMREEGVANRRVDCLRKRDRDAVVMCVA